MVPSCDSVGVPFCQYGIVLVICIHGVGVGFAIVFP